ncbi:sensor histidine kinase [Paenibacillus sp. 32352]|uniref:sensor histidine kinase n=1 Tax=Paenibacillus sp. 32352 TaxID=1969111 RepID=UPI0009ACE45D|nr:sensor histidine kinase [Paenibacillus sp. 32352]
MRRFLSRSWRYVLMLTKSVVAARRWLIAYVVLILLPASVLLYWYTQKSSQILDEEVTQTMLQTLKQAEINLNSRFDSIRDTSNAILMNPKLHTYLRESSSYAAQLDAMKELGYLIDNAQANPAVLRVRLFVDSSKYFSNERVNFFPWDSLLNRSWYPEVANAGGRMIWTGAYEETYIDKGDIYVVSNARVLRDPDRYDAFSGVLVIDVTVKTLEDILSTIQLNNQQHVYMLAPDGTIVLDKDRSLLGTRLKSDGVVQAMAGKGEGVSPIVRDKDQSYVVFTTIRSTGWKLVVEVPKAEISSRAVALNQVSGIVTLLGATLLFLLLVFILMALVVRGLNNRMQTVIRMIKREGIERLDERSGAADGGGDLNLLEKSVDNLIHKVHDLMEETFRSRVQEREAQLRALQAQINPHFFYNMLDTINWVAIGHKAPEISQMIGGLARYFRLSLNKGQDVVSVTDELELAKVYLELQQSRFPRSFVFHIQVEDLLELYVMPKLTLQPIVENALLHGIRESERESGEIIIRARMEGEDLVLSVQDDGIGMAPELANRLLMEPRPDMRADGTGSSYGLYNVNERIKLFAGEEYGLTVQSEPGAGTTVTVRSKGVRQDKQGPAASARP